MSVCTISRDENKEVQEVYAPNDKPSILFRSIVEAINDSTKEGKEKALKVWARAYTDSFKKKFGNWEILSEAKKHLGEVKGLYKTVIDSNLQLGLFEAAAQANSSTSEKSGAIRSFGKELVKLATQLFPNAKPGDKYEPAVTAPMDDNGEPLVHTVLNSREKQQAFQKAPTSLATNDTPEGLAKRLSQKMNIPFTFDNSIETLGAYRDGKVIINPEKLAPDTVLHEFTHPFVEAIRISNPSLFKNLAGRASEFIHNGQKISEFVTENNPDLDPKSVDFQSEVITTAIALEALVPGSITDNKKFIQWMKTVISKIADYINSLISDPDKKINPEDLNVHMSIKDLGDLMRLDNEINLDVLKGNSYSANQTASATSTTLGSKDTIDYFNAKQEGIELKEEGDISYYTDGSIDPLTKSLRKFTRLTEYVFAQFKNKDDKEPFDPDKYLDKQTAKEFKKRNASLTEKINYGEFTEPVGYDEVKAEIKRGYEEARIKGKIMHKMIEGYLKHNDIMYFAEDLAKLKQEGGLQEHDLLWFGEKEVQGLLSKLGVNTDKFGNVQPEFRDNVASELMMVNDALGLGTSNDGFIEHSDGTVSFADYKTGKKFLTDEHIAKKMMYANGLYAPVYDSRLDKAKLELVMRMIVAKLNKPDLKVRDLKIAYLSKAFGTQIRNVDIQQMLDFINNNYIITIQELEKQVKKDPSLQPMLDQKKKEYKAMKDGKVFDFHNYRGEAKILVEDPLLVNLTDPNEKIKILKKRVAEEARQSLIKVNENAVDRSALKRIKESLFAVLNNYKSADVSDVRTDTKDITWFASKAMGLRDQVNAFLKSISLLYEESVENSTKKINQLLGEQSEFRKADRALHKEYKEKHGGLTTAVKTFSYADGNTPVAESEKGIFDFMYTWKNVAGENVRQGAVYTEQDYKNGTLTEAQWNYYKQSKSVLKEVYEAVRNKVAYVDSRNNKAVTYGEEYIRASEKGGFNYEAFNESFLPIIPFQNTSEIIEKNVQTKQINPLNITKEWFMNYRDAYDLSIQNENKFNIGMPLKYMSNDYINNDDHSFNVSAAVDVFARHMINKFEQDDVYNIGMTTIAAMSDTTDSDMKDAKGRLHLVNSIDMLQSFLNQNILGERRKTLSYWGKKNVTANKRTDMFLDNISGFISKNAFWFAPVTSAANTLYGLMVNGREAVIGSISRRLFGDDNAIGLGTMAQAAKICGIHQFSNIWNQGNIRRQFSENYEGTYYKDKINFMMKMYRLNNKNHSYGDHSLAMGVHNRMFIGDNAYVMQGLGEDLTNEIFVVASLLARKVAVKSVDADGKEVTKYYKTDGTYTTDKNDSKIQNMWDAYEMNDVSKEYEYKGPTRFIDKDGNEVKGLTTLESLKTKTFLERMYGAYSPEQRVHLERYALGRMVMKFRKFWITNIRENFTIAGHNQYVGEYKQMFEADGITPKLKDGQPMYEWKAEELRSRLKIFTSLIGSIVGVTGTVGWNDDRMTVEDKKQFLRMCYQLSMLGFAVAIGLGGVIPPEDKDKLYAKRIVRLTEDLSAIHPLDLLRATTTIDSYPTQLYKATNATLEFMHSVATDDVVPSGPYKGDYKGWNTVEDFIPVYHAANQAEKLVSGK